MDLKSIVSNDVPVQVRPWVPISWGISSAGRAPALQAGGHRFDPVMLHHSLQKPSLGEIAQLARACGSYPQG